MKKKTFRLFLTLSSFSLIAMTSCKQPVNPPPVVPIRISIYGTSKNPVNLNWAIHGISGTLSNQILNNIQSPLVIERSVIFSEFGPVELTITDSGPTGSHLVAEGVSNSFTGTLDKNVTLDEDTEIPLGSGSFIVGKGDFLRDAGGHDLYIIEDPTVNRIVKVSDEINTFSSGAWHLYTSNRSSITVTFSRDGTTLYTMTKSTNKEAVNMAYGSLDW